MQESTAIMFTIQSWYIIGPVFIIGLLGLFRWAKRQPGRLNLAQYLVLSSFGIYLLCVIHLVFFPIEVNIGQYSNQAPWYKTINFIPILTIDIMTFLLNVLMLIPFGMYIPFLHKSKISVKRVIKFGFMLSLSFELVQLLIRLTLGSGRSTDINDLLANTAGAVIGFLIVKRLYLITPYKNVFKQFQL